MYYKEDTSDIKVSAEDIHSGQFAMDHPAGYRPDPGLVDAVNVALILNKPLLMTGEPGTGKTQLAYSVAWQLASRGLLNLKTYRFEKFETKSTSVAKDLFYGFDILRRFHAAQTRGSPNNVDYITYNALGKALINALPADQVQDILPTDFIHTGRLRSVVLIDEIDKAPRDFPNDLLNEIEQMYFKIPELGNVQVGGQTNLEDKLRPLVFITSNSEKNLPDPFLRRCIYYHIPFPSKDQLCDILLSRLSQLGGTKGPLFDEAIRFFLELREESMLRRKISPAELIQWLTFMIQQGATPGDALREAHRQALAGIGALIKDPMDQQNVRIKLQSFLGIG